MIESCRPLSQTGRWQPVGTIPMRNDRVVGPERQLASERTNQPRPASLYNQYIAMYWHENETIVTSNSPCQLLQSSGKYVTTLTVRTQSKTV
jgi:hypothetical protein